MPRKLAFCRSAPAVRFIFFAISISGVPAFEYALSWRSSSVVHGVTGAVFFFAKTDAP
jgi:hypothetical protein